MQLSWADILKLGQGFALTPGVLMLPGCFLLIGVFLISLSMKSQIIYDEMVAVMNLIVVGFDYLVRNEII